MVWLTQKYDSTWKGLEYDGWFKYTKTFMGICNQDYCKPYQYLMYLSRQFDHA